VVTFNYRLGALGYLAHPDLSAESAESVSGNYGALDQIRALQWVQENIEAFGGDPNQVTIAGQSSGATDVCVLMTSALSEGLFHGAIMQSGSCGVRTLEQGEESGKSLAGNTSCAEGEGLLECLRAMPAKEIIEEMPGFIDFTSINSGLPEGHMYMPYMDGWVLEGLPLDRIQAAEHHPVPVLLGSTSHETAQAFESTVASGEELQSFLVMTYGEETGQALFDVYPPSEYESAQEALLVLSSDMRFTNEARRMARFLTEHQGPAVYRYYFTHFTTTPQGLLAPAHTIDMLYTFGLLEVMSGLFTLEDADAVLLEEVLGLWTRFIAHGDPNHQGETAWSIYESKLDNSFVLDVNAHMENGIQGEQCDLWESIFQY
jgi:para-nitrobenzyl esterase